MRALGSVGRALLLIFGLLLIVAGGFWALQGLGIIMWPAESFMLADRRWTFYGALTAAAGILLVWFMLRRRRR